MVAVLLAGSAWGAAGSITTAGDGGGQITRLRERLPGDVGARIESDDIVTTQRGWAGITFADRSTVRVNPHSRLLIDSFVYDPQNSSGARVAMRVGLGTVRFASGGIAKTNPAQVAIATPTATVAVRGTDFAATVDEAGRSTVVLLPSCVGDSCTVGAISVGNLAGTVLLDRPFQATYVASASTPPTPPVILDPGSGDVTGGLKTAPPRSSSQQSRNEGESPADSVTVETGVDRGRGAQQSSPLPAPPLPVLPQPSLPPTPAASIGGTVESLTAASSYTIDGSLVSVAVAVAGDLVSGCDTVSRLCVAVDGVIAYPTTDGLLSRTAGGGVSGTTMTVSRTDTGGHHVTSVRAAVGSSTSITVNQDGTAASLQWGIARDLNTVVITQRWSTR